ncbi:hypothetical protein Rostov7_00083 [Vibrio phage Rostov 7]|nr:hypothetical protein Rostov7_00083 [Vibrio phage Rostov 7]
MKILSLFDGMSCGRVALEQAGLKVDAYYASEIDRHAIKVAQANWPRNIQLGDITNWREWDIDWASIDLVTGGFPCQAWSIAGKQLGDKDERGMLFWTMLDVMKKVRKHNPKAHFLIENVKMKKEFEQYITHHTKQALGEVHKILINSSIVAPYDRPRYYWTSFEASCPSQVELFFIDVVDGDLTPMSSGWHDWWLVNKQFQISKRYSKINGPLDKGICMTARQYASWNGNFVEVEGVVHKPNKKGLAKLCGVPINYFECATQRQAEQMVGNGWTVSVISHLLGCAFKP